MPTGGQCKRASKDHNLVAFFLENQTGELALGAHKVERVREQNTWKRAKLNSTSGVLNRGLQAHRLANAS